MRNMMQCTARAFLAALLLTAAMGGSKVAAAHESTDPGDSAMPMMDQGMMAGQHPFCPPGCVVPPASSDGHGMMSPGMGQGMTGQMPMMGQGMMMGPGMGQGMMMGPGMGQGAGGFLVHDLTEDEARHIVGHRLTMAGLPNLSVGAIEAIDVDRFGIEIVTGDGVVVQRLEIDRHTGMTTPVE